MAAMPGKNRCWNISRVGEGPGIVKNPKRITKLRAYFSELKMIIVTEIEQSNHE